MKIFHPKAHFKTVQAIDLSKLQSLGIHNLIVDLDETLRKRNSDHIPEGSVQWIEDVKKRGFNVC
ncbi:MAG: YqeG family HAD IIIA-type phosphatase, partial [bacterium]